jgi:GAF domain-containing protein
LNQRLGRLLLFYSGRRGGGYLLMHPFAMLTYILGRQHPHASMNFFLLGRQLYSAFGCDMLVMGLAFIFIRRGGRRSRNKSGGEPFTDDERPLLESIAEEIAFAIRNAKIFEYVVKSYCKQRQGANSCKGCKRPLKSWTPCAKYLAKGI